MRRFRRAWILIAVLVAGGPATAAVADAPRVVIAGDHIGNAFLNRPNTRVWLQTSTGLKRVTRMWPNRNRPSQSGLPTIPPASLVLLGSAALVSGRMIRRRLRTRLALA